MTTLEASAEDSEGTTRPSIWGRHHRLQLCDDAPEELETTTEASAKEYDPRDLTTTTEASAEESEETTRLIERPQRRSQRCVYGPRKLTMTVAVSARGLSVDKGGVGRGRGIDDASKGSKTTTKAAGAQRQA